nr:hypothetical protein [uncultured Thermus sp.]
MDEAPGPKVIACYNVGDQHVGLDAAPARGTRVTHTPTPRGPHRGHYRPHLGLPFGRGPAGGGRGGLRPKRSLAGLVPQASFGPRPPGRHPGMGCIGQATAKKAKACGRWRVYTSHTPQSLPSILPGRSSWPRPGS